MLPLVSASNSTLASIRVSPLGRGIAVCAFEHCMSSPELEAYFQHLLHAIQSPQGVQSPDRWGPIQGSKRGAEVTIRIIVRPNLDSEVPTTCLGWPEAPSEGVRPARPNRDLQAVQASFYAFR